MRALIQAVAEFMLDQFGDSLRSSQSGSVEPDPSVLALVNRFDLGVSFAPVFDRGPFHDCPVELPVFQLETADPVTHGAIENSFAVNEAKIDDGRVAGSPEDQLGSHHLSPVRILAPPLAEGNISRYIKKSVTFQASGLTCRLRSVKMSPV